MSGTGEAIEKGRGRFVKVSTLGFLILGVWLLAVAGGLLLLGGDWPGLGLLALGVFIALSYRSPSFKATMASLGDSTGYVVWTFFANVVMVVILGYIAYDNLSDPFVTYSPVTVQALVHAGVGFILAVGSLIANVLALQEKQ